MSLSGPDIAFATELFQDVPALSTRKMFGGLGIYSAGAIFAVLRSDGQILLKARGDLIDRFEALGAEQWTHTRKNGVSGTMPYWTLPDAALDDPDLALDLARASIEAAG